MKRNYGLTLLCLLLAACTSAMPIATQPTVAATPTGTEFVSPMPFVLTPTLYSSSTPEPSPTPPAPPTVHARYFMTVSDPVYLSSIRMIDEQNGWAIDVGNRNGLNHIFRTRDGGHSWRDITPYYPYHYDKPTFFANAFFALDANTAWVTTPNTAACIVQNHKCTVIPNTAVVWHTSDGGQNWQGQFITPLKQGYTPLSMQFLDAETGWLLTSTILGMDLRYQLYQTTDGGTNWSQLWDQSSRTTPEDPHEKNITAIAFQDSQTAWMSTSEICCEAQIIKEWDIYRSTNAGITWDTFSLPAPDPLPETFLHNTAQCAVQDMKVTSPNILDTSIYCYVYEGLSKPEFYFHYHSPNGGSSWISFPKTGDVQFIDAMLGWKTKPNEGAYDIERTEDGGITWTTLKTVQWNGSLHFINKFVGWALAGSNEGSALVHTVDGGRTWEVLSPVVAGN